MVKLAKQEPSPPNVTTMGRFFLFREVSPGGDVPGNLGFEEAEDTRSSFKSSLLVGYHQCQIARLISQ
jgi:hypothetical protein